MAYNFIFPERDQSWLLPPSIRDWLSPGDFVWFIIDVVSKFDIRPFQSKYRDSGVGHAAYDPQMMLTLLIYAYSFGERSSRRIEILCERDIAFRAISGNLKPDHSSIARFRQSFEKEIEDLFVSSLRLCQEAGLAKAGIVALDGTKMPGNASLGANRTRESLEKEVKEILAEAKAKDEEENKRFGEKRGDELPEELRDSKGRQARIEECLKRLREKEEAEKKERERKSEERKEKEKETGKKLRGRKPKEEDSKKEPKANPTDPDSRIMKTGKGFVQGYNAQAVANEEQVILAAEITQEENDQKQLKPMFEAAVANLKKVGEENGIGVGLADAGYPPSGDPIPGVKEIIVATQKSWKEKKEAKMCPPPRGRIPGNLSPKERMQRKLRTKRGKGLYKLRSQLIEPVFGQIKSGRGINCFSRRGKEACNSEWKLICATHNLLKLWKKKTETKNQSFQGV